MSYCRRWGWSQLVKDKKGLVTQSAAMNLGPRVQQRIAKLNIAQLIKDHAKNSDSDLSIQEIHMILVVSYLSAQVQG